MGYVRSSLENVTLHALAAALTIFPPGFANSVSSLPSSHLNLTHVPSTVTGTEVRVFFPKEEELGREQVCGACCQVTDGGIQGEQIISICLADVPSWGDTDG